MLASYIHKSDESLFDRIFATHYNTALFLEIFMSQYKTLVSSRRFFFESPAWIIEYAMSLSCSVFLRKDEELNRHGCCRIYFNFLYKLLYYMC